MWFLTSGRIGRTLFLCSGSRDLFWQTFTRSHSHLYAENKPVIIFMIIQYKFLHSPMYSSYYFFMNYHNHHEKITLLYINTLLYRYCKFRIYQYYLCTLVSPGLKALVCITGLHCLYVPCIIYPHIIAIISLVYQDEGQLLGDLQ